MNKFFIERNNYRLFAKRIIKFPENNSKPTLVFLHDSWGCVEMWNNFPEELGKLSGLNVLAYDRRGYGQSSPLEINQRTEFYLHEEANELIQVLDACGIGKAILYGHSDGATIALIAAALYPQRFLGLILEGPHSFIEISGKAAVKSTRDRAKKTKLISSLKKYHGDKTSKLFRLWYETWLSEFFENWTITPILHQIACPVLAFQGENDEFGTIQQLEILKKEINTSVTIAEISKARHTPRKEAEKETLEYIKTFFNRETLS